MRNNTLFVFLLVLLLGTMLFSCERIINPDDTSLCTSYSMLPLEHSSQSPPDVIVPEDNYLKLELEPDKTELPDFSSLQTIKQGMAIEEVQQIAGNPQRTVKKIGTILPGRSLRPELTYYIYDISDGPSISVLYGFSDSTLSKLFVEVVAIIE